MDAIVTYLDVNAMAVLFNVALLVIVYLIARLVRVRPLAALATGFLPLYGCIALVGLAVQSGVTAV